MKKKGIGVLMGGMSPEREVSLMSGRAILQALPDLGYRAVAVEADELLAQRRRAENIEVGILDDVALGAIEIVPRVEFDPYEAKYTDGLAEHLFPGPLAPKEYQRALDLGFQAHRLLGCEGATRVDLLCRDGGEFFVLEVNTLPGMTPLSLLPEIARGVGILFPELVERILRGARLRIPVRKKGSSM